MQKSSGVGFLLPVQHTLISCRAACWYDVSAFNVQQLEVNRVRLETLLLHIQEGCQGGTLQSRRTASWRELLSDQIRDTQEDRARIQHPSSSWTVSWQVTSLWSKNCIRARHDSEQTKTKWAGKKSLIFSFFRLSRKVNYSGSRLLVVYS